MTPDLVLCSSAKRTRSTLKKVRSEWGKDVAAVIDEVFYHADAGEWLRHLRGLDREVKSVLLIGHNPALENLAHRLAGDGRRRRPGSHGREVPDRCPGRVHGPLPGPGARSSPMAPSWSPSPARAIWNSAYEAVRRVTSVRIPAPIRNDPPTRLTARCTAGRRISRRAPDAVRA